MALPPKTFELLVVLAESGGRGISKDELMSRVWPDCIVEEANLSHHVCTLRKALGVDKNGNKFIETIPRRGYRFVASLTEEPNEPEVVVVEERNRSPIIIEEEVENSKAAGIEISPQHRFAAEQDKSIQLATANASSRLNQLARHKTILLALIVVGILTSGGAAYFFLRNSFKDKKASAANIIQTDAASKMKFTRLTNFDRCIANISPDGKFICYIQNYYGGLGTLWVRQIATNHEVQLLEPGERVFNGTAFSPDGQFIYYSAIDPNNRGGALFRVPVLGGPAVRLIEHFGSMFSLSLDGKQAAFYRYFEETKLWSIIIAGIDGSNEQTLLTIHYPEQTYFGTPSWSPDGKRIAFAITDEVDQGNPNGNIGFYTLDINSRVVSSLSTERWTEVGRMAWTYDGKKLYFVAARPRLGNQLYYLDYPDGEVHQLTSGLQGYGNYGLGISADGDTLVADGWESSSQIWTVEADGRTAQANRLTTGIADGANGLTTLPDGRIAYVSRTGDDRDLWTMKPDGTEVKPLTSDAFFEREVMATSDGRYLVFASNRAGGCQIFRLDVNGENLKQLTFGDSYNDAPDGSADGQWIVYASRTGDKSTIWKVSIDGGTPIQLTDYHSIKPSFSPNGKFISCIEPKGGKVEKGSIVIIPASGGVPIKTFSVVQFGWSYLTPRWMPNGQAIVYTVKHNSVGNLWIQPLSGGAPKQLTDFKTDYIFNFTFSRDGRNIFLARGPNGAYVVLIKDFN